MPESDEDPGIGSRSRRQAPGGGAGRAAGRAAGAGDPAADETAQAPQTGTARPVTVTIDFDNMNRRIVAVPGVPRAQLFDAASRAVPGIVYYLETPAGGGAATLQRYRLSDRRAAPFVTGASDYVISADTHKMLYRGAAAEAAAGEAAAAAAERPPVPRSSSSMPIAPRRRPARAGSNVALRMYLDRKEEYKQIFKEGWRNQRDYLYVPNMHGADWNKMEEMYGQILPYVNHRADLNYLLDNMGAEIAIGHSYVRGGDMPDAPANPARAACSARTSSSRTGATRSRASTKRKRGTRNCARRCRNPAST